MGDDLKDAIAETRAAYCALYSTLITPLRLPRTMKEEYDERVHAVWEIAAKLSAREVRQYVTVLHSLENELPMGIPYGARMRIAYDLYQQAYPDRGHD